MLSLSLNMMASPRDLASPRTALIPVPRLGEVRSARPGGGLTGGLSGNGLSLRPGGGGAKRRKRRTKRRNYNNMKYEIVREIEGRLQTT